MAETALDLGPEWILSAYSAISWQSVKLARMWSLMSMSMRIRKSGHLQWQVGHGVVEFRGASGDVCQAELALEPVESTYWGVGPDFRHLDQNGGDGMFVLSPFLALFVLLFVLGHFHWRVASSQRQLLAGMNVCKGGEYPLPFTSCTFIIKNVHGGVSSRCQRTCGCVLFKRGVYQCREREVSNTKDTC